MNGELVVIELLAAFGIAWSAVGIVGGFRMFHMLRGEFGRRLLPLFVLACVSFFALLSYVLYPSVGVFLMAFFIVEALFVSWLFSSYTRSLIHIIPAVAVFGFYTSEATWLVDAVAVAIVLYFAVFSLLVIGSSMKVAGRGSPVVLLAVMSLIASASLQLSYIIMRSGLYLFVALILYTLSIVLLIMPAVAVEVVIRHAPQQE